MPELTYAAWVFALTGVFVGGFVSGLAGFGNALFSLGFMLFVLPPQEAVAVVLALATAGNALGMWKIRRDVPKYTRQTARFVLPAIAGIPVGSALLTLVSATGIKLFVSAVFLVYAGAVSAMRSAPKIERSSLFTDTAIGFGGGILGGMAGLSGALTTIWSSLQPWTKEKTRTVLQGYNFYILALSTLWLASKGTYTPEIVRFILVCLPVLAVGTLTGLFVYGRLSDTGYKTALVRLMFVAGLAILLNELRVAFF